jgi:hypothetical protein
VVRESSVFLAVEGGALDLLVFAPFQDHAQVCPMHTSLANSSYTYGSQEGHAPRDRSNFRAVEDQSWEANDHETCRSCEKRRPLQVIAMGRDPEVPFPVGCQGGEGLPTDRSAAKAVEQGSRRRRQSQSSKRDY